VKTWSGGDAPLADGVGTVDLLDLVVVPGRTVRYGCFGSTTWTVLHHSMLTQLIWLRAGFPLEKATYAAVHDLHETYTGDITTPIKGLIREAAAALGAKGDPLRAVETQFDARIYEALCLEPPDPETVWRVKLCDDVAKVVEGWFFGPPGADCLADMPEERRAQVREIIGRAFPGMAEVRVERESFVGRR